MLTGLVTVDVEMSELLSRPVVLATDGSCVKSSEESLILSADVEGSAVLVRLVVVDMKVRELSLVAVPPTRLEAEVSELLGRLVVVDVEVPMALAARLVAVDAEVVEVILVELGATGRVVVKNVVAIKLEVVETVIELVSVEVMAREAVLFSKVVLSPILRSSKEKVDVDTEVVGVIVGLLTVGVMTEFVTAAEAEELPPSKLSMIVEADGLKVEKVKDADERVEVGVSVVKLVETMIAEKPELGVVVVGDVMTADSERDVLVASDRDAVSVLATGPITVSEGDALVSEGDVVVGFKKDVIVGLIVASDSGSAVLVYAETDESTTRDVAVSVAGRLVLTGLMVEVTNVVGKIDILDESPALVSEVKSEPALIEAAGSIVDDEIVKIVMLETVGSIVVDEAVGSTLVEGARVAEDSTVVDETVGTPAVEIPREVEPAEAALVEIVGLIMVDEAVESTGTEVVGSAVGDKLVEFESIDDAEGSAVAEAEVGLSVIDEATELTAIDEAVGSTLVESAKTAEESRVAGESSVMAALSVNEAEKTVEAAELAVTVELIENVVEPSEFERLEGDRLESEVDEGSEGCVAEAVLVEPPEVELNDGSVAEALVADSNKPLPG